MNKYLILLLFSSILWGQKHLPPVSLDPSLTQNASSVILDQNISIKVLAIDKYLSTTTKTILLLDASGLENLDISQYYSKNHKIKSIGVSIYDHQGDLINSYKQKDFKDLSLSGGVNITDGRILSFQYKPVKYPITIVFTSQVESKNTAFLPKWSPIESYNQSIVSSSFSVETPSSISMNAILYNPDFVTIDKDITPTKVEYTLENFPALINESYSATASSFLPKVIVALDKVHLEGVNASFNSWQELGDWYYQNLVHGSDELPLQTKQKVQELIQGVEDPLQKAKILYEYMQSKTRYISIQLGIGGWKPTLAQEVDKLGYSDCKGLSNYLRALYKEAGIESYLVVLYGSSTPLDIQSESVCLQGNHMILAIALENGGYYFVEATDQKSPFGHIAGFTDNRTALILKPNNSELVKTTQYPLEDNLQKTKTLIDLQPSGDAQVQMQITSLGGQFDNRSHTYYLDNSDKDKFYKRLFYMYKIDSFTSLELEKDVNQVSYQENISFQANKYAKKLGNRLLIALGNWNTISSRLTSAQNRRTPFSINSSWVDKDQIVINLPQGYTIDKIPPSFEFESEFGYYKAIFVLKDNEFTYTRELSLVGGTHDKEHYKSFREFIEKINRNDQVNLVLKPTN